MSSYNEYIVYNAHAILNWYTDVHNFIELNNVSSAPKRNNFPCCFFLTNWSTMTFRLFLQFSCHNSSTLRNRCCIPSLKKIHCKSQEELMFCISYTCFKQNDEFIPLERNYLENNIAFNPSACDWLTLVLHETWPMFFKSPRHEKVTNQQ